VHSTARRRMWDITMTDDIDECRLARFHFPRCVEVDCILQKSKYTLDILQVKKSVDGRCNVLCENGHPLLSRFLHLGLLNER
jgi:hypothetical protein